MKYQKLSLSRNGIVRIVERDGETIIYQGKAKRAPSIDHDVISVDKIGGITEIVLACGKTKEEKAEEKERSKTAMKKVKLSASAGLLFASMCGANKWY